MLLTTCCVPSIQSAEPTHLLVQQPGHCSLHVLQPAGGALQLLPQLSIRSLQLRRRSPLLPAATAHKSAWRWSRMQQGAGLLLLVLLLLGPLQLLLLQLHQLLELLCDRHPAWHSTKAAAAG